MNIVINEPYRKLIEGESLDEIHKELEHAIHEDFSRASAANIRLMGKVAYFRPRPNTYALLFQPTAEMKA